MPDLRYFNTNQAVLVGDIVSVKRWFRSPIRARVVYVPEQSAQHSELEYDDTRKWAYQTDDGTVWAAGYYPSSFPFASKSISLIKRSSDPGISPDYELQ